MSVNSCSTDQVKKYHSKARRSTVLVSEGLELVGPRSSNAYAEVMMSAVFSGPFFVTEIAYDCISLPQLPTENMDVPLLMFPVALLSVFGSVIFPFFSAISFTASRTLMVPSRTRVNARSSFDNNTVSTSNQAAQENFTAAAASATTHSKP